MGGVAIFLAVILLVGAVLVFAPGWGIAARMSAKRMDVSSDEEMGMGAPDADRPEHKGAVPEQEEREKGTLYPSS
jgi:hypothetical protein